MQRLKRYFPIPYLVIGLGALAYLVGLAVRSPAARWAAIGAVIAIAPLVTFLLSLAVVRRARTSRNLVGVLGLAVAGTALSLAFFTAPASWLALGLGLLPAIVYVFWYSRLDRSAASDTIRVGGTLPDFELRDASGDIIAQDHQIASLYMFIRGNWCPLCVAQVREVAAHYRDLQARGAEVFLISPQPETHTEQLSKRFDAPMRFCVDRGGHIAKQLGIEHVGGVPFGIPGRYDSTSVLPTVIITDANRRILFADLTDNYRVRPEVRDLLEALT